MMLRWLGNSCVEIFGEKHILIDPNYLVEPGKGVDVVLVTHEHGDHFDPEKFEKLGVKEVIAPKATLEEYGLEGTEAKPGMEVDGIKIFESWCWKAKESVSYFYKGILHAGDSAKFPEVGEVKVVFTACFPDYYEDYLKEFKRMKPELIIPFHYSEEKIENAKGLKEILDKNGLNCKILEVGGEIEV
ncbi:MAG: MBL fold metallo-hydrolase [Archaeoglobus sp.]|nr:MBL fold metallo-hydrolase [Archaeoglobus sp.]